MDPTLQWFLMIIGSVMSTGVVAAVKALYAIRMELSELKRDVKIFIQSAEERFENLEGRVDRLEDE